MKPSIDKMPPSKDFRCFCGSLVARILKDHVELKCRRCKRIHLIPIQAASPGAAKEPSCEPKERGRTSH